MVGVLDTIAAQLEESTKAPAVPPYFNDALEDAERLLHYAAEIGVAVNAGTRDAVLAARTHGDHADEQVVASLLTALTALSAKLRPVTAESLKACSVEETNTVHTYLKWAVCLAVIIVPFSFASFLTSGISDAIRKDIDSANAIAVKLATQLQSPSSAGAAAGRASGDASGGSLPAGLSVMDVVTELQQFASLTRAIDGRALRLNRLVVFLERDPFENIRKSPQAIHDKFQLPPDVTSHLQSAFDERIVAYQDVRYFAQTLLDDVALFYGGIATCILPVLYALLGTCAYLLRSFDDQTRTKTFIPAVANSARFLIAGIGGAVVGLFNNFTITQGASIPPLAIAFLVGYAVDVFFSFLESLLQAFSKSKSGTHPAAASSDQSG
jgi:hypothetical protein